MGIYYERTLALYQVFIGASCPHTFNDDRVVFTKFINFYIQFSTVSFAYDQCYKLYSYMEVRRFAFGVNYTDIEPNSSRQVLTALPPNAGQRV